MLSAADNTGNNIFPISSGILTPAKVLNPQQISVVNKYGIIAEKLSAIAGGTESGNLIRMLCL